ncbi:FecR domain-containing protein [Treponema sp.]|uniref:FecR family protein n=1 Tax=Treponema sp. TaxID=166 RepID=UPI00298D9071|nr:FecR domain-containing protein [Treponema sp.]MCR5614481.1 FecR domain-containing protein [Treponema sp.]
MKRILTFVICSLLCMSAFSIEAKVLSVSGKVQVQRQGAWRDINVGEKINQGEMIQTGFKSEAVLQLVSANQNSKITVAPLSRITLEQLVENGSSDTVKVNLTAGSVKSEVKKTQDRRADFTVRGPVATASVRGTVFGVRNYFASTRVDAESGTVSVWRTSTQKSGELSAPCGSYSVRKNQSAKFSTLKETSPYLNSVEGSVNLNKSTEPVSSNEYVLTSGSGNMRGEYSASDSTASINLFVEVEE